MEGERFIKSFEQALRRVLVEPPQLPVETVQFGLCGLIAGLAIRVLCIAPGFLDTD